MIRSTSSRGRIVGTTFAVAIALIVGSALLIAPASQAGLFGTTTTRKPAVGAGGGGGTPAPQPPEPPPATSIASAQGEALVPTQTHVDTSAFGGSAARATVVEGDLGVPTGTYIVRARVKAATAARADLTVGGELVGAWTLSTSWQTVDGVAWLSAGEQVGVHARPPTGSTTTPKIDVDWIAVETSAPMITSRGTGLRNLDGSALFLRGVVFPAYQNTYANSAGVLQFTKTLDEDLFRWGATLVRFPMNQEFWIANCNVDVDGWRMSYRTMISNVVDDLTTKGIAVMLTLTVAERGQATGCAEPESPTLKEMADARSVQFWSSVAQTYEDNPLVLFDLFNEPHDISTAVWRDGGSVSYQTRVNGIMRTKTYAARGMQDLLDAVRGVGARNVVTVGGTGWASKADTLVNKPLDGAGITASQHSYCHDCAPSNPHLKPGIETLTAKARARFPFLMTEGGWEQSNDPRFNRALIDWVEGHGGDAWTIYAFFYPEMPASVVSEWNRSFNIGNGLKTLAPARTGAPVWNELAPIRVSRGFDAATVAE